MDDPTSSLPHKQLKVDAATVSEPGVSEQAVPSGLKEENLLPPRKKLKKDSTFSASDAQLQHPSKTYRRIDEVYRSGLAQMMDQSKTQQHKEEDVGITEFVSPDLPGFTGILKKRYTDFLVNEILPNGEVVHLTALRPSKNQHNPKDSFDKATLTNSISQDAPVLAKVQESSKTEAVEANVPPKGAVKPEPAWEELELKSTEEESELKARETQLKPTSTQEGPKAEEPLKEQLGTSEDVGMMEQEPATAAADTQAEIPEGSTGAHKPDPVSSVEKWQNFASVPKDFKLSFADESALKAFFEPNEIAQITTLCNRIANSPHRKPKDYGQVKTGPIKDREVRTKIHRELRRIYKSYLESYTDDTGAMIISAAASNAPNRNPGAKNVWHNQNSTKNSGGQRPKAPYKPGWKELGGEYLHFTLYKENKDTMEVISYLARQLKLSPQAFQFAGTKDRRAVTAQRVSVYRVHVERMMQVGRTLRNAKIGNYKYEPRGLELGELMGNEFLITLRDCQFQFEAEAEGMAMGEYADVTMANVKSTVTVKHAAKQLSEKGFINYFGLQRFGTFSTRTDTIGKKMLQGDFKGAVEAILQYHPAALEAAQDESSTDETLSVDDKNRAAAINSFQTTGKVHPAVDIMPRKFSAESAIIRHLGVAARANDFQTALQLIPKNLRLMYVHAYQSLIWNLAASHRWQHSGEKLLLGDLVLVNEHKGKVATAKEPEQIDADGEVIVNPAANDSAALEKDRFIRARHLTAEDIASGQYSIYDIVLPTPGFDILYPDNTMKEFYEKTMASELGGELNPHDMRRQWKDISLSGSYRKLLAKPMGEISVEQKLYQHAEQEEQFVQTDVEKLYEHTNPQSEGQLSREHARAFPKNGVKSEPNAAVPEHQEAAENGEHPSTGNEEGANALEETESSLTAGKDQEKSNPPQKLAFIVKLQLGSSQYATMALRELMKLGVRTYKPDLGGGR